MTKQQLIKDGQDEEAIDAYIEAIGEDYLDDFEEAYIGKFDNDKEFAEDMAFQLGLTDKNNQWPLYCIDWEWASRELMNDYTEQDGYYFRNL